MKCGLLAPEFYKPLTPNIYTQNCSLWQSMPGRGMTSFENWLRSRGYLCDGETIDGFQSRSGRAMAKGGGDCAQAWVCRIMTGAACVIGGAAAGAATLGPGALLGPVCVAVFYVPCSYICLPPPGCPPPKVMINGSSAAIECGFDCVPAASARSSVACIPKPVDPNLMTGPGGGEPRALYPARLCCHTRCNSRTNRRPQVRLRQCLSPTSCRLIWTGPHSK